MDSSQLTIEALQNAISLVEATLANPNVVGTDLNKLDCKINYLKNILSYLKYEENLKDKTQYSKITNIPLCLN
jgi:hypothetical protein